MTNEDTELDMMLENLATAVETVEFISINGRISEVRVDVNIFYLGIYIDRIYKLQAVDDAVQRFLEKNNSRYEFLRVGGKVLTPEGNSWKLLMRKKV